MKTVLCVIILWPGSHFAYLRLPNNNSLKIIMLSFPKALLALGLLSCASLVQAAPITLYAEHFSVTYDDTQASPYKPALLSGSLDTVYFQSSSFKATSPGAQSAPSAQLVLSLNIDSGYVFSGLSFVERGNYYLSGGGAVGVETDITLTDLASMNSVALNLASDSLNVTQGLTLWELGGVLGPVGQGASQTLQITLDSTLFSSAPTGLAFIQNTYAGFQIMTEPAAVPEPTSLALLLAGILAATLAGRRVIT